MKPNFLYTLLILLMFSCAKQDDEAVEQYCNNAKIIKATCGGTIVQILQPDNVVLLGQTPLQPIDLLT